MHTRNIVITLLIVWSSGIFLQPADIKAQSDPARIPGYLDQYKKTLAPQKLFLHTDRDSYAAGESIWFKGYLLSALTHVPETGTANVYVELINIQGATQQALVLAHEGGTFHGDLPLAPDIPDGNYVLRAYTDPMLNEGTDYLFVKHLYIFNPSFANSIDNSTRNANRSFNQELEGLQEVLLLHFFPEGGNLLAGIRNKVAVKATDGRGRGLAVQGVIRDSRGVRQGSFETHEKGFGLFELDATAGEAYAAELSVQGRRSRAFPLPDVSDSGMTMHLKQIEGDKVVVRIFSMPESEPAPCALLVHNRGNLVFFRPDIEVAGEQSLEIPHKELPTGINHFTLFSDQGVPLSERLIFVNHDDQAYFDIRALALRAEDVMALNIDVLVSDREGNPIDGNFSASVQYGEVGERSQAENIFTYLFLSGDLQGLVQDPAWYFDFERENLAHDVDMLMLTHGWRRFAWNDVGVPGKPVISHVPKTGVTVTGSLTGSDDQQGIRHATVKLRVVEDPSLTFETTTNDAGHFVFEGMQLQDSVLVEIIPPMLPGRQTAKVHMQNLGHDALPAPGLVYTPNIHTVPQQIVARGSQWSGSGPNRSDRGARAAASAYGAPDQVVYADDNQPYTSVLELLRDKAVGITVTPGGQINFRGPTSINFQGSPIYIIDGVESEGAFMSVNMRDLDRIEIFKGASSAAFGVRGANGALVAYTRRRDMTSDVQGANMFLVAGLHSPRIYFNDLDTARPQALTPVQTAHWEPVLTTGTDGLTHFQFFPIPGVSRYRIVIQGVGNDGKVGFGEFVIGR